MNQNYWYKELVRIKFTGIKNHSQNQNYLYNEPVRIKITGM